MSVLLMKKFPSAEKENALIERFTIGVDGLR